MKFVFFHVPKCGGVSIKWALRRAAKASGLKDNEILVVPVTPEKIGDEKVITGHFGWGVQEGIGDHRTFIVLRDPVERAISHFYYTMNLTVNRKKKDKQRQRAIAGWYGGLEQKHFDEIMSWKSVPRMDDCDPELIDDIINHFPVTYFYFLGIKWVYPHENMVELACQRLENDITAFGITERMKGTEKLLNAIWPFKVPVNIRRENVTPKKGDVSQEIRDKYAKKLALEIQVYDFAVELFDRRIKEIVS